jgi:glycosyltransferase involved in cell wall biosynthesis
MRITELLVTQYHLRVELHLFGEGAQRRHLESLVAASEALRSRVVLHGMIQAREKWSAIDSCDIFLNTSFTEGQCIVALEVLSRGRPLAATPVGALPDILDDPQTGDLIPLNDAGAAAKIVADLAARWTGGGITPAAIRDHFEKRFGRKATVAAYAELFREMMET